MDGMKSVWALLYSAGLSSMMTKRAIARQVGRDTPELKPVEMGPLPPQPTEVASPVVEAGTIRAGIGAGSQRLQSLEEVT